MSRKIALYISISTLMLLLTVGRLLGQDPQALFAEGNARFERGDYAAAVTSYDSVLQMGFESPALYYNLGNAHYKLGHVAPAILSYERALRLDPAHEDARFNLQLANLRVVDRVTPTPEFIVLQSWRNFRDSRSSGQWAAFAVVGFWLAALLGALFLLTASLLWKRVTFFGGLLFLLLSLGFVFLAFHRRGLEQNSREGIVTAANVYVKSAPDAGGTDLFILHEGAKVRISDSVEGWLEVTLEDGKKGWMAMEKMEEI